MGGAAQALGVQVTQVGRAFGLKSSDHERVSPVTSGRLVHAVHISWMLDLRLSRSKHLSNDCHRRGPGRPRDRSARLNRAVRCILSASALGIVR